MACNLYTIKVVEGNAFTLVLPLKKRTYVANVPIDEDIDIMALVGYKVTIGGVEFACSLDPSGVQVPVAADALARGTYDIVLTATYRGAEIRAAYFEALQVVKFNSESEFLQYIAGSPIVAQAAYVIGGPLTDAELEALKEEWREKIAEAEQAQAEAEAAKREWEQKAADLDGVAQEATLTQGVQNIREDISHINIDTSDLAKEATLERVESKVNDISLSSETLETLADSWAQMVTNRKNIDGYEFTNGFIPKGIGDILFNKAYIRKIKDDYVETMSADLRNSGLTNLQELEMTKLSTVNTDYLGISSILILKLPALQSLGNHQFRIVHTNLRELWLNGVTGLSGREVLYDLKNCREVHMPNLVAWENNYNQLSRNEVNLILLELGAIRNSFSLVNWSPTNALLTNSQTLLTAEDIAAGFTSNREKLLYNIREYIAANLPIAPLTITFSAEVKAAILADQPTADAFTNKNLIIA